MPEIRASRPQGGASAFSGRPAALFQVGETSNFRWKNGLK
jgi:hypothetical protein